ncbi:E3 ubiquitin-protein ligase RAD18 isoform X2 [Gasterosteus aculeatus]|uniref:RING-type E3 ubiquitin transferase n=1 Tax=Gasterosteus aculeatus aculeatus TaxID=481459 RepID=A0AAQ4PHM6_GASAC
MALQIEANFPPGFACLKNVDTLLRCPICFDFLNISMMTKCSHNFCSLCIRKFFCYKLQCPVCNTQATEQDLRTNRLLDDLVVNFQAAREQLSKANFDSPPMSPRTPAPAVNGKAYRGRGQKGNSSVLSHFFQKRPKTSPTKETQRDGSVAQCAERTKIQTACTHNANDADLHSATDQPSVVVKEEPMDAEEASIQGLMSVKQEAGVSHGLTTKIETAHSSLPSSDVKPVIKVECPVCSVSVSQQFINKHLDTCLTRGEKKESLRSSPGTARRPMTKLVYNLLSTLELKRRLKDCHLSTQGSRDQLIKRHQEFVQIYNAQCDSLNPKSAEDIAKELEANEKIKNQLQGKAKPVRCRLETSRQTRTKQKVIVKEEDEQETHSAGQAAESKSCSEMKVEGVESDTEPSERRIELSSSPTYSDVSISSSISDIFGPEPTRHPEDTERTSVQKRTSSMRGDDAASSLVSGKRRRKT